MKKRKLPPLLRRILLGFLAVFLLGFGILVWSECIPDEMDEFYASEFEAFLEYKMKPEPKEAPSEEIEQMQLLALDYDVEDFREGAVTIGDMKEVAQFNVVQPGAFQEFLKGEISSKFPYIWPYVIAGSVTVTGNSLGDEPVVGFYNPYFDAVILTKWKFESAPDPGFKLIEAVPVTGRAFVENRGSQATDKPIWDDLKEEVFEIRLVRSVQSFVEIFEERFDPFGTDSADLSANADSVSAAVANIENQVFYLMRWVIDAQDPSAEVNYADAIEELQDALSASSPGALEKMLPVDNPQSAELLFTLEQDIRAGLKPYLVVKQNVIFINPISIPTAFLSVYFEPGPNGYQPALAALFNFEAEISGN